MKTICFFNNKGGVGKTSLVYHMAWMYSELGYRVLAVDLDPQANLTTMFLEEEKLEQIWPEDNDSKSILSCILPIMKGLGDIKAAPLQKINSNLRLIPGDLGLSQFEDMLSDSWPKCLDENEAAYRIISSFHRIILEAVKSEGADIVLMDVGPNLGAINRSALIAAEYVIMPLAPGLFSLQGLKNLGPTLQSWRKGWTQRLQAKPYNMDIPLPEGKMTPSGYVIMQHVERKNRPVKAYQRWVERIPKIYSTHVLKKMIKITDIENDPNSIGRIKNYQSLMPMAEDARKPIFKLTAADGAIGAHAAAVSKCYTEFKTLAETILQKT